MFSVNFLPLSHHLQFSGWNTCRAGAGAGAGAEAGAGAGEGKRAGADNQQTQPVCSINPPFIIVAQGPLTKL